MSKPAARLERPVYLGCSDPQWLAIAWIDEPEQFHADVELYDVGNINPREHHLVASGFIKWDGCANLNFHTDKCMEHFCGWGRGGWLDLTAAIRVLWQLAAEVMGDRVGLDMFGLDDEPYTDAEAAERYKP